MDLPLHINLNEGQNKFEVHISKNCQNCQLSAQNRPGRHFCPSFELAYIGHFFPILTLDHTKTISSLRWIEWCKKLSYILFLLAFYFWPTFCSKPHMGSIAHMDPKPHLSCGYMSRPSRHHPQPIAQNHISKVKGLDLPNDRFDYILFKFSFNWEEGQPHFFLYADFGDYWGIEKVDQKLANIEKCEKLLMISTD